MAKSEPSSDESTKADEPTGDAKTTKAAKTTETAKAKTSKATTSRSGDPSKKASTKLSKRAERRVFDDPVAGPRVTPRAVLALLLVVAGIAWIAYYYVAVRADPLTGAEPTGPGFIGDLADWNYLIGFAAFFLGLIVAAHPSTPLGRGRGVVTGMLFCFLFGLAWICTFYAITANPDALPVFDDLGQKNLFVGIASMGVGFVYATRWE